MNYPFVSSFLTLARVFAVLGGGHVTIYLEELNPAKTLLFLDGQFGGPSISGVMIASVEGVLPGYTDVPSATPSSSPLPTGYFEKVDIIIQIQLDR